LKIRAWHLVHARWAGSTLSGEGASLYPGRWNRAGELVVYLASSLALAVLETRVHLETSGSFEWRADEGRVRRQWIPFLQRGGRTGAEE